MLHDVNADVKEQGSEDAMPILLESVVHFCFCDERPGPLLISLLSESISSGTVVVSVVA